MKDCIFCEIVSGKRESARIWEDKKFLAILDGNPNVKGMTLVLTKDHYDSYVFDIEGRLYREYMAAAKEVARILEKGLKVKRVALVMEGLGVNHAHLKLYPIYGLGGKFVETWAAEREYFEAYPGYISTRLGPKREAAELEKVAREIAEGNRGK